MATEIAKQPTTLDELMKQEGRTPEQVVADLFLIIGQTDVGRGILISLIQSLGVRAQIEEMQGWNSMFEFIQNATRREDLSAEDRLFFVHLASAFVSGIQLSRDFDKIEE